MGDRKVDIIIPIYNAYDDLALCLESLYANTDLERNRLILINDNSPDGRIREFLDNQERENVIVIHNDVNKGFSNNINIGMAQSEENDVILLNSDTVVTAGWVEKMENCAYLDSSTGTVTPLSNNASLCSVPKPYEENTLAEGQTVAEVGETIERCSLKKYPRIPVANGFCMYVKREVIDRIGNFDAETFGRGYGEENDFCNRAEQAGYHHVMCDDTYIYHSGTKSFVSKEKEKYIREHDRILRDRYPEQMHDNDVFFRDNPNRFVAENAAIYLDLANGRKNLLLLAMSDFRKDASDHIGGTQLHVRDLSNGLRDQYNVFVAARDRDYLNLTVYYGKKEKMFRFYIGKKRPFYEFRDKKLEELWRNIFSAFRIDLVHIHHVISTSFDVFFVAKEYRIPVIFTAHDYYMICPSVKMLDDDGKVCVGKDTPEKCKNCLNEICGITDRVDYITLWREKCREVLSLCEYVIVPDESAKEILILYYPELRDKMRVVEHGYEITKKERYEICSTVDIRCNYERVIPYGFSYKVVGWAYFGNGADDLADIYLNVKSADGEVNLVPAAKIHRPDVVARNDHNQVGFECVLPTKLLDRGSLELTVVLKQEETLYYAMESYMTPSLSAKDYEGLNIAFIGGINAAKGGKEICSIIEAADHGVNWYVFGGTGIRKLDCLEQGNLVKTGYYAPEDLPLLLKLHEIDIIGILSVWPETYSYTLTEAVLNKIPVIVTDIGALGRRTRELGCGWTVSLESACKEFIKKVIELSADKAVLQECKKHIACINLKNTIDMVVEYIEIYKIVKATGGVYEDADYQMLLSGEDSTSAIEEDYSLKAINNVYENNRTAQISATAYREMENELNEIKNSLSYKIVKRLWKMKFPGKQMVKRIIYRTARVGEGK